MKEERQSGDSGEAFETVKRSVKRDAALIAAILALAVIVFAGAGLLFPEKDVFGVSGEETEYEGTPVSGSAFFLDTFCTVDIYDTDRGEAETEEILGRTLERLEYYDGLFNPSKEGSDIYRINHREENTVFVRRETARLFESAAELENMAGGDFNVAIGPLTELWDFDNKKEVPSEEAIKEALSRVHYKGWSVSSEETPDGEREYYFNSEYDDLKVDIGAFAKGFIADELKAFLVENNISSAVVNLGGNVLCIGERPDGRAFNIGLKKPEKGSGENLEILEIRDKSVVTAGIYERYFEKDGVYYHHIFDTETGYPVSGELAAVSVAGEKSVICDILSTALFIKGAEEGKEFLESYNNKKGFSGEDRYEAYFITKDEEVIHS